MRISATVTRALCALAVLVAVCPAVLAGYTARLWFRNETTGEEGPGAIAVVPGQAVSLNFSFHRNAGDIKSKWAILQMFIDLAPAGANAILTDADANTWDAAIAAYFRPTSIYPIEFTWQPTDGPIYDDAISPGDSRYALITTKGVYSLVGCAGSTRQAYDYDALGILTFTVGQDAAPGAELHWGLETRRTDNGISTQMYTNVMGLVGVTDNYLAVPDAPVSRVSGQVSFEGLSANAMSPRTVSAVLTRVSQAPRTIKLHLGSVGSYYLPLVADGYTLSCQQTHWLRKRIDISATPGDVCGCDLSLVNGDCTRDGIINMSDLGVVLRNLSASTPDPYADLDEDGIVGMRELSIVFANFGMVSDPP